MPIGQEIGNKLSPRSFGWDKPTILEKCLASKDDDIPLYRVWGAAASLRKFKIPANQVKDGVEEGFGLFGQFQAVGASNSPDPEQKAGSVLYLPRYIHEMVEAALQLGDTEAVKIAFDIYARYDEKSATSYVFVGRDLLNQGSSSADEVKAMLGDIPMIGSDSTVKKLK